MVTWNESFGIQDVLVESEEVECYLEIAFWQVSVRICLCTDMCAGVGAGRACAQGGG